MHLKSFVKRNLVEGTLVFAGVIILVVQFAVAKHLLSEGGVDHTTVIGAPLDDTYIHCRFAENLFAGHGYSFNPGQVLSADTSPLWVAMIALGGFVTSHFDLVAMLLSAIAWLLLAPAVYRVARYVFVFEQPYSIAAGICMLLQPRLILMALSGMETTFATLLALIAIALHIRSREIRQIRISEAVILGFGIAVRPEFCLLVLIASLDWIFLILKRRVSAMGAIGFVFPLAISSALVLSIPYGESSEHHLLYHSSLVQGAGFRFPPDFYYIGRSLYIIFENFWWVLLLMPVFILHLKFPKLWGNFALVPIFLLALPIIQGFVAPQYRHFGRYVFLVLPLAVLSIIAFLRINIQSNSKFAFLRQMRERKRIVVFSVFAILFSLPLAFKWTVVYGESVRNINDQHLAVALWITAHASEQDRLAVDDVGAIGYLTKRPVIDLTGLVSPEMFQLQHDPAAIWNAAREVKGANLFIIYTRLDPSFYSLIKDSLDILNDSLDLLTEFRVRPPLVASADTVLSVFRVKEKPRAAR
ncbi:MAG: hypothetical protein Q8916_02285 [Bacteroidota bacterium]|nr:hypothetical protein [Bacteroidota bacterium]MDP4229215.1 hypothetical protein [Bacteroidota bacterium]MDP4235268.1 hypothetical protein [Bacteroidota bacterium]